MNSKKKFIEVLITLVTASYILMHAQIATAEESQLLPKDEITTQYLSGMKIVSFNPKINKIRLFSAKEQGFPEGAAVYQITKTTNALVTMNAGFFTEGKYRGNTGLDSITERICYYTRISKTYAFPSAILKINSKLFSDTKDNYLPALGIDDTGEIKIGEVKAVWSAIRSENGRKFILDRISEINPDNTDAIIYYHDSPLTIKEVVISNNKITHIKIVPETEIAVKMDPETKIAIETPNCYWLHEPSLETIAEFSSLQVGDNLSYSYELQAAAYSEQGELKEKDDDLSAFFNKCSHVVSGGHLLIYKGEVDPRISKAYPGRKKVYTEFGTAICLRKNDNEIVSMIAASSGEIPRDDFIKTLKDQQCEYAISLDGGRSTTLITRIDDKDEIYGKNRVVSDIVAIMPRDNEVSSP